MNWNKLTEEEKLKSKMFFFSLGITEEEKMEEMHNNMNQEQ